MEPAIPQQSHSRALLQDLIPVLQKFDKNDHTVSDIHVTKNQFTIGRARDNDEVICNVMISRHHCILECNENGDWFIKNLSVNGTILNGQFLTSSEAKSISLGDVVQFSTLGGYKYFFTLRFKDEVPVKRRRLEGSFQNETLPIANTFADYQELMRQNIAEQLSSKRKEHNDLGKLLEECMQRQGTENDYLMNQRKSCLENAMKSAEKIIDALQRSYNFYVSGMREERREFDEQLARDSQQLQNELKASDAQLERIIGEKMDKLAREHQTKWTDILKDMMKEDKFKQEKLENQNLSLTAKLKKAEDALETTKKALRDTSVFAKQLQQQQAQEVIDLEAECTSKSNLRDKVENILDEQLSCSICSEIFVNPTSLNCSHTFCEYCITSWSKKTKKANCPICRVRIKSMNQSRVFDCLIEKMVSELSSESRQHRQQLITERRGS